MSLLKAIASAIRAALAVAWVIVKTPFGWIWRRQEVPVTPAEVVAFGPKEDLDEDGLTASERHIDDVLRDYICARLVNARRPRAEHEPLPPLNGIPSAYASWARRLTDAEIRSAVAAKKSQLARHLQASHRSPYLPCALLPPVLPDALYAQMARAEAVEAGVESTTKAAGGKAGAGGGPKGGIAAISKTTVVTNHADALDEILGDFRERLSNAVSGPRPR